MTYHRFKVPKGQRDPADSKYWNLIDTNESAEVLHYAVHLLGLKEDERANSDVGILMEKASELSPFTSVFELTGDLTQKLASGEIPPAIELVCGEARMTVSDLATLSILILAPMVSPAMADAYRKAQVVVDSARSGASSALRKLKEQADSRAGKIGDLVASLELAKRELAHTKAELVRVRMEASRPIGEADKDAIVREAKRLSDYWWKDDVGSDFVKRNLSDFISKNIIGIER